MNATCLSPLHKIILLLVAALTLSACASDDTAIDSAPKPSAAYVDGEVLVGLKPATRALRSAVRAAGQAELLPGGKELERIVIGGNPAGVHAVRASAETATAPPLEVLRLQLPSGMAVEEAVAQLSGHSEVLYAEPNYKVRRALLPNDEFFSKQWGWQNAGGTTFTGKWGTFAGPGPDISAAAAWEVSSGNGSVVVATIDSGIEYDHPDLAANMWLNPGESGGGKETNGFDDDGNGFVDDWHGWNFVANNNNPRDDDVFGPGDLRPLGHGSHVAGIIGAAGNNSIGVSGINWNVKLMPIKFLSSIGEGDVAKATTAINYAIANGARVINASYEYGAPASLTELNAIAAAGAANVLFVAAAGNSGSNIDIGGKAYPAAHALDNIIAVAATDPNDNKASFSNYGVTSVDLGAPGVYLYSTVRLARTGEDGQVGYDYMSGTSMAAPVVSGAAALVWSKDPDMTATAVRQLLLSTVDIIPSLNGRVASGGRLNLARAMTVDITLPAPAAPTGLTGVGEANGARLTWIDNASDEASFIVERSSPAGEPFIELARLGANTTTYFDGTVRDGVVASYRVRALAGISPSAYSNVVDVTLPLRPPADLTAYADTLGIHLNWADISSVESGFKVERRSEGASAFSEIATLLPLSTGYTDKDVVAGGRYIYRVRSYSTTLGDSVYTDEILAQMAGGGSASEDRKCFIATAAFGTPLAPQVNTLRTFRDRVLLTNAPGRLFVALYYRTSPPLADFIAKHDLLRAGVRTLLRPLVWLARTVTPNQAQAMAARPAPPIAVSEEGDVVAGELLVCFRPEVSAELIATILRSEQSERLEEIPSPQGTLLRIKLATGVATSAAQKRFSVYPEVVYAEPNRRVSIRKP